MKIFHLVALGVVMDAAALHAGDTVSRRSPSVNLRTDVQSKTQALRGNSQALTSEDQTRLNTSSTRLIDFVYCWAGMGVQQNASNGSIDSHQAESDEIDNVEGYGYTEMRLALRSLQVNAPWFNKAYLLVDGPQSKPSWAANDPRIQMVDRCSLFPDKRDCPTKNTHACQSVTHLVPGLQEHFVIMDDDIFFVNPVEKVDFFALESGLPLMAVQASEFTLVDMYGRPHDSLRGPDIPPWHSPKRINQFAHVAIPMLKSFAIGMEKLYTEWFAFVRSHKTRFVCCSASFYGNGLDEDFKRIYPALLMTFDMGVQPSGPTPDPICECPDTTCIRMRLNKSPPYAARPGANSVNVQNCAEPAQWTTARDLIMQHMEQSMHNVPDPSLLVPMLVSKPAGQLSKRLREGQ